MSPNGDTSPAYFIIHGFGEGRMLSRNLRKELQKCGFQEATAAAEADMIITHSAGSFELTETYKDKLVLILNPSNCSDKRSWIQAMSGKVWQDFRVCLISGHLLAWAGKCLWNMYYIASRPGYNKRIYRIAFNSDGCLPELATGRVVVINNQFDPWAKLVSRSEILTHPGYVYITYPGSHDQIWITPDIYAGIVQSWYEST